MYLDKIRSDQISTYTYLVPKYSDTNIYIYCICYMYILYIICT